MGKVSQTGGEKEREEKEEVEKQIGDVDEMRDKERERERGGISGICENKWIDKKKANGEEKENSLIKRETEWGEGEGVERWWEEGGNEKPLSGILIVSSLNDTSAPRACVNTCAHVCT